MTAPHPMDFFSRLFWIDSRPLLETIDPYRRDILSNALFTFRNNGTPQYNVVLCGRAKKNYKSTDLILAAFYRLLMWESPQGNDCLIVANDEGQAGDDLALGKKLVRANPDTLGESVHIMQKSIRRKDRVGEMKILASRDAIGAHGKTGLFIGYDEIHGMRNWDLMEALAPDPTRPDVLRWITSYDSLFSTPGIPLYDLKLIGKSGADTRMLFSWYSGDDCTDPEFAGLPPEQRANPSMGTWPEGPSYLEQARATLPGHKFRRLHLNLPGAPEGAFFDGDAVLKSVIPKRSRIPFAEGKQYVAFVDMSGGSNDDACFAIAHMEGTRRVLDLVISQDGKTPFSPLSAVMKFVRALNEYEITRVFGDDYAGETFKRAFENEEITYVPSLQRSATEIYEAF
jgi:hypothetical protein